MFIVHGKEKADQLRNKYTVLELDTIQYTSETDPITLYTVLDTGKLSLDSMTSLDQFTTLHQNMIDGFKVGDNHYCKEAISMLKGQFGGQVDSFYDHMLVRLDHA